MRRSCHIFPLGLQLFYRHSPCLGGTVLVLAMRTGKVTGSPLRLIQEQGSVAEHTAEHIRQFHWLGRYCLRLGFLRDVRLFHLGLDYFIGSLAA